MQSGRIAYILLRGKCFRFTNQRKAYIEYIGSRCWNEEELKYEKQALNEPIDWGFFEVKNASQFVYLDKIYETKTS